MDPIELLGLPIATTNNNSYSLDFFLRNN